LTANDDIGDVHRDGRLYLDDLEVDSASPAAPWSSTRRRSRRSPSRFDPQPFHLDEAAAKATLFGRPRRERLAHRCHDTMKLL